MGIIRKNIFITGTTSGIGAAAAEMLLQQHQVILALNRNSTAAEAWKKLMLEKYPDAVIHLFSADLSETQSLSAVAASIAQTVDSLDVLLFNAGGVFGTFQTNSEGIEKTMATNHFATFALTYHLLPLLKKSAKGRVVVVSSGAHYAGSLVPERFRNPDLFNGTRCYADSKLANVLFTLLLNEKLKPFGITANCLNPGLIQTPIGLKQTRWYAQWIWKILTQWKGKPASEGARWPVELAISEQWENTGGAYFSGNGKVKPAEKALNPDNKNLLWKLSKDICHINDPDW